MNSSFSVYPEGRERCDVLTRLKRSKAIYRNTIENTVAVRMETLSLTVARCQTVHFILVLYRKLHLFSRESCQGLLPLVSSP